MKKQNNTKSKTMQNNIKQQHRTKETNITNNKKMKQTKQLNQQNITKRNTTDITKTNIKINKIRPSQKSTRQNRTN